MSPVTQAVVVTNLALGGVPTDHYRLIEGTSDAPEPHRAAGDRGYGLIVIDGDHSEEVAYNDLLWAESLAVPDALVILDDYDDPAWPGVAVALKRYMDRPESTLRLVGTAATTAFLRQTTRDVNVIERAELRVRPDRQTGLARRPSWSGRLGDRAAPGRRADRRPDHRAVQRSSTFAIRRATQRFVADVQPDVAIIAAARVGGIHANRSAQGQFLYDNLMISANALEAARSPRRREDADARLLVHLPAAAHQPIAEEELLTGPLEQTNEGYAIAKIAALEMAKMYRRQYGMSVISLMPTNLYGPNDNFDLETAHVLPALIRRFHEAKADGLGRR